MTGNGGKFVLPASMSVVGRALAAGAGRPEAAAFLADGRRARWGYSGWVPAGLMRLAEACRVATWEPAVLWPVARSGWRLPWRERLAARGVALAVVVRASAAVLMGREAPAVSGPGLWAWGTEGRWPDARWRVEVDEWGEAAAAPEIGAGLLTPLPSVQPEWRPADPGSLIGPPPAPVDTRLPPPLAGLPRDGRYGPGGAAGMPRGRLK